MLPPQETLPFREFLKFAGRVFLFALLLYPVRKALGLPRGSEGEDLLIALAVAAAVYPTARKAGLDLGRLKEYWGGLRGEAFRAFKYLLLAEALVFAGLRLYDFLLTPWGLPLTDRLLFWNSQSQNPVTAGARLAELLARPLLLPTYLVNLCAFTPLLEEFLFRRWLYAASRRLLPAALAAPLNAALFGALHGTDFFGAGLYGLCYCLAYERTGRLETPVLMHAYGNLLVVALAFGEKLGVLSP